LKNWFGCQKARELSFIVIEYDPYALFVTKDKKKIRLNTKKLWKKIVTLSLYARLRVLKKRGIA